MADANYSTLTPSGRRRGVSFVALALTGLLSADVLGAASRLALPSLLGSHDSSFQVAMTLKPIVVLSRIFLAATVVVFLVWFFDARVNAERSDWRQRYARSWTFWGWIIPVAALWIPVRMMADIWRASLPADRRGKIAWLPSVWWASWLATGLMSSGQSETGYGLQLAHTWVGFGLFATAGVTLIIIIQTVSGQKTVEPSW